MNPKYTIKNFRVFDREGANFELAPLTILTGCNSSGKSSMAKSLLVLDNYITKLKNEIKSTGDFQPERQSLDFSNNQFQLGRFGLCLNNKADKDEAITFSYEIYSKYCFQPLTVVYTFYSTPNDELDNGWLRSIEIQTADEKRILNLQIGEGSQRSLFHIENLRPLKDSFIKYALLWYNKQMQGWLFGNTELRGPNVAKENSFKKELEPFLKELKEMKIEWNSVPSIESLKTLKRDFFLDLIKEMTLKPIVYRLPILSVLDGVSKYDIRSKFDFSVFNDKVDEEIKRYILERIISDFENSRFDCFIDYFRQLEDCFVKKCNYGFYPFTEGITQRLKGSYGYYDISPLIDSDHCDGRLFEFLGMDDAPDWGSPEGIKWINEHWEKKKEMLRIDFQMVVDSLMDYSHRIEEDLEEKYNIQIDDYYSLYFGDYPDERCYKIKTAEIFSDYCAELIKDALVPSSLGTVNYVGSDRATVRRLYSLGDKADDFDELLLNYLHKKNTFKPDNPFRKDCFSPGTFINEWVNKFEIGHSISFKNTAEGLGVVALLHKDQDDEEGHLLADEGYGITQFLSILLNIELQIMNRKEIRAGRGSFDPERIIGYHPSTIIIEEPETHLHPRFQSLLAEMFVEAYKKYNIHFIIETHSEYLIRKLQTYIPLAEINEKDGLKPEEISLYYLYNPDPTKRPKKEPQVKKIGFRKDGSLNAPFGSGFFDEADNLAMSLLIGNN